MDSALNNSNLDGDVGVGYAAGGGRAPTDHNTQPFGNHSHSDDSFEDSSSSSGGSSSHMSDGAANNNDYLRALAGGDDDDGSMAAVTDTIRRHQDAKEAQRKLERDEKRKATAVRSEEATRQLMANIMAQQHEKLQQQLSTVPTATAMSAAMLHRAEPMNSAAFSSDPYSNGKENAAAVGGSSSIASRKHAAGAYAASSSSSSSASVARSARNGHSPAASSSAASSSSRTKRHAAAAATVTDDAARQMAAMGPSAADGYFSTSTHPYVPAAAGGGGNAQISSRGASTAASETSLTVVNSHNANNNGGIRIPSQQSAAGGSVGGMLSDVPLIDSCDWAAVMLSQYRAECTRLAVPIDPRVCDGFLNIMYVVPSATTAAVGATNGGGGLSNRRDINEGAAAAGLAADGGVHPFNSTREQCLGARANVNPHQMAAINEEEDPSSTAANGTRVLCLALGNLTLGPRGAAALAAALRGIPLTILSLSECFLEDEGCRVICQTVAHDPLLSQTLLELDLRGNAIRSGAHIATLVVACFNLQSLRVSWNKMGLIPSQCSALIAAARTHRNLSSFDISNNVMDHQCLLAIAELILGQVPQLTHLDVSWNLLGAGAGGSALHGALIRNNTLLSLGVNGNGFSRQELEGINDKLAANEKAHWDARNAHETQQLLARETERLRKCLRREEIRRVEAEKLRDGFATEIHILTEALHNCNKTSETKIVQLTTANTQLEAQMIEEKIDCSAKVREAEDRSDEYRKRCDEATTAAQQLRIELESKSRTFFDTNESNKTMISTQHRELSTLKDQLSSTQAQLSQSTEDFKRISAEMTEKRLENVQLSTDLSVSKEEAHRRDADIKARLTEIGALEARIRDLSTEVATLKGQIFALEESAAKHRLEVSDMDAKLKLEVQRARDDGDLRLKRTVEDHAVVMRQRDAERELLQQEIARQKEEAVLDRDRLTAQLSQLSQAETEKRKAVMDLQQAQQAVRRAENNESIANDRCKTLQEELNRTHFDQQDRLDALERELRAQFAPLENALRAKDEHNQRLEREVQRLIAERIAERERQAEATLRLEARLMSDFRSALHNAIDTETSMVAPNNTSHQHQQSASGVNGSTLNVSSHHYAAGSAHIPTSTMRYSAANVSTMSYGGGGGTTSASAAAANANQFRDPMATIVASSATLQPTATTSNAFSSGNSNDNYRQPQHNTATYTAGPVAAATAAAAASASASAGSTSAAAASAARPTSLLPTSLRGPGAAAAMERAPNAATALFGGGSGSGQSTATTTPMNVSAAGKHQQQASAAPAAVAPPSPVHSATATPVAAHRAGTPPSTSTTSTSYTAAANNNNTNKGDSPTVMTSGAATVAPPSSSWQAPTLAMTPSPSPRSAANASHDGNDEDDDDDQFEEESEEEEDNDAAGSRTASVPQPAVAAVNTTTATTRAPGGGSKPPIPGMMPKPAGGTVPPAAPVAALSYADDDDDDDDFEEETDEDNADDGEEEDAGVEGAPTAAAADDEEEASPSAVAVNASTALPTRDGSSRGGSSESSGSNKQHRVRGPSSASAHSQSAGRSSPASHSQASAASSYQQQQHYQHSASSAAASRSPTNYSHQSSQSQQSRASSQQHNNDGGGDGFGNFGGGGGGNLSPSVEPFSAPSHVPQQQGQRQQPFHPARGASSGSTTTTTTTAEREQEHRERNHESVQREVAPVAVDTITMSAHNSPMIIGGGGGGFGGGGAGGGMAAPDPSTPPMSGLRVGGADDRSISPPITAAVPFIHREEDDDDEGYDDFEDSSSGDDSHDDPSPPRAVAGGRRGGFIDPSLADKTDIYPNSNRDDDDDDESSGGSPVPARLTRDSDSDDFEQSSDDDSDF